MISTQNISVNNNLPKMIQPGNNIVKINDVKLFHADFMENNGYRVVMECETKPIDGFEGLLIDKDDPSKGNYLGQIGSIDTNKWYHKDGVTKSGKKVSRDMCILSDIKKICIATHCETWFTQADGKYETIEQFVEAFNIDKPFKDKWVAMCVAGREYSKTRDGKEYKGYNLYLPFDSGTKRAMVAEELKGAVIQYNEAEHLKTASTPVSTQQSTEIFNSLDSQTQNATSDDVSEMFNDDEFPWDN